MNSWSGSNHVPAKPPVIVSTCSSVVAATSGVMVSSGSSSPSVASTPSISPSSIAMPTSVDITDLVTDSVPKKSSGPASWYSASTTSSPVATRTARTSSKMSCEPR